MSSSISSIDIVNKYFKIKQKSSSRFSLRRFAQLMGMSPSYLSRILKGKKKFPMKKLKDLTKVLALDDFQEKILRETLKNEQFIERFEDLEKESSSQSKSNTVSSLCKYKDLEELKSELISKWYNVAIMDLTTCTNFQFNNKWIAKKLNIPIQDVKESIQNLLGVGLLKIESDKLIKADQHLRFSTAKSKNHVRQFHRSMIAKALWEMDHRQDDYSCSNRLLNGITIAADPKQIQKAKEILITAIHDAAEILSSGDCTELFQLNLQLFGITNRDDNSISDSLSSLAILPKPMLGIKK